MVPWLISPLGDFARLQSSVVVLRPLSLSARTRSSPAIVVASSPVDDLRSYFLFYFSEKPSSSYDDQNGNDFLSEFYSLSKLSSCSPIQLRLLVFRAPLARFLSSTCSFSELCLLVFRAPFARFPSSVCSFFELKNFARYLSKICSLHEQNLLAT